MGREILFRGKGVNRDLWFVGDLRRVDKKVILVLPLDERPGIDKHKVDPNTVGQYTGLKDKNGTRIFEGDIVRLHIFTQVLGENLGVSEGEEEMIVSISIGSDGVRVNNEPLFVYLCEGFDDMEEPFEIIGNIYENPELINIQP